MKQKNNIFSDANYHMNNEDYNGELENITENNNYNDAYVYENNLYKLYNQNSIKQYNNNTYNVPNNNTYNKNFTSNENNQNKKCSINNNSETEKLDLSIINEEYNNYIANLKQQISEAREVRKDTEYKAKILKHRLTILKNQEQKSLLEFKRIKSTLQNILKNRIESENRMKLSISLKKNHRRGQSNLFLNRTPSKTIKTNKSYFNCPRNLDVSCVGSCKNKTISNFYRNNNSYKSKNYGKNYDLKEEFDLNNSFEKNKFREQLLEKLKEDQEQKKKIEEEIKNIEKEQFHMFNSFKYYKNTFNNENYYKNNI